jgi:RHS repeat-associated protein
VVWEAMYKPFGEATVHPNSTVTNHLRFPGQYEDEETGLHYNYHRYYDPRTGRYLRPDPLGQAGGINLFLYAEENPVNHIDSLGLQGSTTFPGTGIPIPIVPVFIPGTPENKQFVKDTEWAIEQIRRSFDKPDPYDIEKAKRNFKNINVPPVRDMGECEEIPPEDKCISGCRKKYSGSFILRQICILGCILAAF